MPAPSSETVFELAEPQHGYFTSAQAIHAGLTQNAVTLMARRGVLERVSRGVYRMVRFPVSPFSQYMEAVLWPQEGVRGVLSHESALAFHGLSDVSPAKVHITLPRAQRVRREIPAHLIVHHADLPPVDVKVLDGVPVTTAKRSILDCHAGHVGRALIRQAIHDGRANGKLLAADAAELEAMLHDGELTAV